MINKLDGCSGEPTCCSSPDVHAIPANLFTSGMFQTGVFGGFRDLRSFAASVPTRWVEMMKSVAHISSTHKQDCDLIHMIVLSCSCFNCKCAARLQSSQLTNGRLMLSWSFSRTCCDPTRSSVEPWPTTQDRNL